VLESSAGVIGTVDLSWSLHKQVPWYVRLTGSEGVIEVGWQSSRWQRRGGGWHQFGRGYDKVAAFAAQLRDFAASSRGAQAPAIGDADALASVAVIAAAYRSAADRQWQHLA
jgi:predicted dehydrogenase